MDRVSAVIAPFPRTQGATRGALRGLFVAVALLLTPACRQAPPPLSNTFESPEALGREVLQALAVRDRVRLSGLALSEAEFRTRVWPELPASRAERNLTADYVWRDLALKSDASLTGVLSTLGGRRLQLQRVEFAGETTNYATFSVSRKTELVVTHEDGTEERVRAFGSIVRADGGVKVFSYVVD